MSTDQDSVVVSRRCDTVRSMRQMNRALVNEYVRYYVQLVRLRIHLWSQLACIHLRYVGRRILHTMWF